MGVRGVGLWRPRWGSDRGGEHTGEPLGRLEVLVLMEIKGQAEPLSTETPIP